MTQRRVVFVYNTAHYLWRFRRELIEGFQRHGYEVFAIVPLSDPAVDKLAELRVQCVDLPIANQTISPWQDIRLIAFFWRAFRSIQPEVVFLFTVKPVLYGSMAARLSNVPRTVSMITGLGYLFSGRGFARRLLEKVAVLLYRLSLRWNWRVFFQNVNDREMFLAKKLVSGERAILINGSGVDLSAFVPEGAPPKDPVFVLVARMIKEKGVIQFVEAARLIRARNESASFWLVGEIDRNPSAISRNQIDTWEREGAIKYLGHVERIQAVYAKATAFVLPTYYREGIPRTILEAMACGLPIITTDTPGCRETVEEGKNGFLVEPRNSLQLAERMSRFLVDGNLSRRMGLRSRELAEEKYDVRKVTRIILSETLQGDFKEL